METSRKQPIAHKTEDDEIWVCVEKNGFRIEILFQVICNVNNIFITVKNVTDSIIEEF